MPMPGMSRSHIESDREAEKIAHQLTDVADDEQWLSKYFNHFRLQVIPKLVMT